MMDINQHMESGRSYHVDDIRDSLKPDSVDGPRRCIHHVVRPCHWCLLLEFGLRKIIIIKTNLVAGYPESRISSH
jgi:hypothetical protein